MSNGNRSDFEDIKLKGEFTDYIIPKGSRIHKVKQFYFKKSSLLIALEFFAKNGKVLLDCS
jgi:hypothetical protein